MKKIILLSLVFILLAGCGPTVTPMPVVTSIPNTPGPGLYIVTKSTGLYEAVDIDAKMIADLSEGTSLVPEDGESATPLCSSFIDLGTTYTLCHMKVMRTGKTGWVLKQWMDLKR